jgi:NADPH-dependent 2,4-dienoyl-CoA reductase/sulfur reductase-like enzyme/rhodanese-related sulfurtransferase
MRVIIVGGVAGGASVAARLRRLKEKDEIIIYEKSPHISYANCGLPYYIGGLITDKSKLTVQTPESFKKRFNIDAFVNHEVNDINREKKEITVINLLTNQTFIDHYDKLVLSPGAKPIIPLIKGVDSPLVFTLRNIPDTYRITEFIEKNKPKKALIVGAGYIGLEMAENLYHRDIKMTIVELGEHVIAPFDYDMTADIHHYLRLKGIDLYLNTNIYEFKTENNQIKALINNDWHDFDMVVLSVGVKPDTAFIQKAAIEVNDKGAIIVDKHLKTNDDDIYALGDAITVTSFVSKKRAYIPLAGPANRQGRIVADNLAGIKSVFNGSQGTAILKLFDMSIAMTGLNETTARQEGYSIDKIYQLSSDHATYYPGSSNMVIKLIFQRKTGKILGAQIVGFNGVDKRIDVLATAIRGNLTAIDLSEIDLAYAPPFGSSKDPVNMLGYLAENVINGFVKQYYYEEAKDLSIDKSITLLDVRSKEEYALGKVDNSINIPLNELRDRIDELDKNRKIFITCHGGMRSYIASRMLSQKGYQTFTLATGYRLFENPEEDLAFEHKLTAVCRPK